MLGSVSCDDSVLDQTNPNQLSIDTYYKTDKQLISAVNAVYTSWQPTDMVGREWFFLHDLRADDMQAGGGQLETPRAQILNGNHDAANPVILSVWRGLYRVVHQSNLVIENASAASGPGITEAVKNRVIGEAKFHRGWAYFDLVSMWGGVPLMVAAAQVPEDTQGRASEEQVYDQIESDLLDAVAKLPLSYNSSEVGRATQGAARAMLARVYMQQGNFADARTQLTAIIQSNLYSLIDNYVENFREEREFNAESLFEISFTTAFGGSNWANDGSGQTNEISFRGQEYGPNAWRNLIPSNELLAEYETTAKGDGKDDPRFAASFYQIGDTYNNGQSTLTSMQGVDPKISWKKYQRIYKYPTEDSRSGINHRIIRYADVLLMLAECENELGNQALAIEQLNKVRSRPGVEMPSYPTANYPCDSQAEVFRAIVHERRVELAGEQVRNRDILRWVKLGKMEAPMSYFDPEKHTLLPIPQTEINNNSKIGQGNQNPGY